MHMIHGKDCGEGHSHDAPPIYSMAATIVCAGGGLFGYFAGDAPWAFMAYAAALAAGAVFPLWGAWQGLRHGQPTVDLLMLAAAGGAAAIGHPEEGIVLLFLFNLSGTLEAYAMYQTHRSIAALVRLRPREALRMTPQGEERVPLEQLAVGDRIRVRPGEGFPIDGDVIEGETWVNEATITGESAPVEKRVGSQVLAGTMNGSGSVLVEMTRSVADTTLERIIHLVEDAQAQKTPAQRAIESWQRPYVLSVFAMAALVFLFNWLLRSLAFNDAFYHAMFLLVAASPCAVVISAPSVILSAIARGALGGVLFKGGVYLEDLANVTVVAFDKTGTLTVGRPSVTSVWVPAGQSADRLLQLAAAVERRSEHHLADTIVRAANERGLELLDAELLDFDSHTGLGVHARVNGTWVGVGRELLFERHGVTIPEEVLAAAEELRSQGQTAMIAVAPHENLAGIIAVSDALRPEAAAAIASLKSLGIEQVVLLTGDHARAAEGIAQRVGIDEIASNLLPQDKVAEIKRRTDAGALLAMVGDGVNDAPALAAASVGIAMGGGGTDVALETADVVLMRDDLSKLPFAVWLSRTARRRVGQNMAIAFGVIAVLVISSFFNQPLWLAVVGHEGSTLVVVLNGLRLLWQRSPFASAR